MATNHQPTNAFHCLHKLYTQHSVIGTQQIPISTLVVNSKVCAFTEVRQYMPLKALKIFFVKNPLERDHHLFSRVWDHTHRLSYGSSKIIGAKGCRLDQDFDLDMALLLAEVASEIWLMGPNAVFSSLRSTLRFYSSISLAFTVSSTKRLSEASMVTIKFSYSSPVDPKMVLSVLSLSLVRYSLIFHRCCCIDTLSGSSILNNFFSTRIRLATVFRQWQPLSAFHASAPSSALRKSNS